MPETDPLDSVAGRLAEARHVAVLTGAGVSAESGVATFRDPDGLWAKFSPQELASMDGFLANPQRVLEWYRHRREVIDGVEPNAGHRALAELQRWIPGVTVITQNVDRLHQRAGSRTVLEVHGNLVENRCSVCGDVDAGEPRTGDGPDGLPRCRQCDGLLRPNVVWFGEDLPEDVFGAAEEAASDADVFLSIGTSAEVYPAAGLPLLARRHGAFVVEINPNVTSLSQYVHHSIRMTSGTALPAIVERLVEFRQQSRQPS